MAEVAAGLSGFSDDEISRLVGPINARTLKVARVTAGGLLLIGLFGAGLWVCLEIWRPPIRTDGLVGMPIVIMLFGGVLPAFAVHRMIRADLKIAPRLLREGTRHRAQVTGVRRLVTMYQMTVEWSDERGPRKGVFDVEVDPSPGAKDVEVITRAKSISIGTVVDDRLYLGVERRKRFGRRK